MDNHPASGKNGGGLSQTPRQGPDVTPVITLNHRDYAVGWICALPREQTAAIAMLDTKHGALPKATHDHNIYTLGRMNEHNVVIACLPKGQYATVPAAQAATWMMGTFPSIRFGLMVGIGAGIPTKVRLGDVVISTPVANYPGVVQWDLGKAEDDGHLIRTGALNNPPTALLTALTKLESQHALVGSKIPEYLDQASTRYPRLESKCKPPESNEEIQEPYIHYGLVASGNQVVKDAVVRDRIDQTLGGNVLCIEMEAAGLMNNFPCIVVRGICDFADLHKKKDWQDYAAAVSAACAKEVLEHVDSGHVQQALEARVIMQTRQ